MSATPRVGSSVKPVSQTGNLAREEATFDRWKRSPAGLSAMGFGRVSIGPNGGNPHLQALIDEKKSKESVVQVSK